MEQRFGHDFSRVRIHSGEAAEQSARSLNANAYTVGHDIAFAAGRFAPRTHEGRRLLAHELTHVVQQSTADGDRMGHGYADRALSSISPSRVVLARDMDAGAPADAGPIAGGSGTSPVPAAPPPGTPALAAPAAKIGAVTFRGSANRIAPTRNATVPVTLSGLPAGGSATLDVEGSGGANGTATITAGATLTSSGTATIRGGTQTTPGNAGSLRIRAKIGGAVVGRSPGFTVAAWPIDFSTSRNSDIDSGGAVGVAANNAWFSDGSGPPTELNEVERTERVDIGSRDNPPFTSELGTSATRGTSGFIAGTASPTLDEHRYGRSSINTSAIAQGIYTLTYRQNFLFYDRRTGVAYQVAQNSGFTITHTVQVIDIVGTRFKMHWTQKRGAAVSVEGMAATAGSGTAASDVHTL